MFKIIYCISRIITQLINTNSVRFFPKYNQDSNQQPVRIEINLLNAEEN